ncbi:ABC transporter ATP-binding protein [Salinibius halmophilus]|uniref:ABC transporter ATP-binding protein n=1 Tax=Salinibius halmophilus TaxID=1853216 RepID=UPI000E66CF2E|nr:ABC transporter ATP-binding protein [Salinibius halmophilus]
MKPLLEVNNLCIDYLTADTSVRAVNNVSFTIGEGEVFGLAGESGCGKSTVAYGVTRLHQPPAIISSGSIKFAGEEVLDMNKDRLQKYRWGDVSMVFQSAMNALNPVLRVEKQFRDTLMAHKVVRNKKEAQARTAELLDLVGISPSRMFDYPHQFSGGMRQRIVIAIALALKPKLIVMDEPTTALDVVVQREILQQIHELQKKLGFSILFITHDLSLMVEFSNRIGIMYAGELVEVAPSTEILSVPKHPYTEGLGRAFPAIHGEKTPLIGIPGTPLDLSNVPNGCRFAARCEYANDKCKANVPELIEVQSHLARCHYPLEAKA